MEWNRTVKREPLRLPATAHRDRSVEVAPIEGGDGLIHREIGIEAPREEAK
jgi:hypothetical protein